MIKVIAEFQTYWQISTGRGAGYFMDSLIDKDVHGLPYVSGKTLKGVFRSAVEKLDAWQPQS
ncbi:MAG: RAMP superfamily CRISPR-associated protein, partial [Thiomicrorhabdus sp.]|nr:RAMP superfamily CRISPR-associated protein [Thiomicrorhabdus sp.]